MNVFKSELTIRFTFEQDKMHSPYRVRACGMIEGRQYDALIAEYEELPEGDIRAGIIVSSVNEAVRRFDVKAKEMELKEVST